MNTENTCILSSSFFGNIQYFSKFLQFDNLIIEQHENYSKQSFRNRCEILGANGIQNLNVPIKKNGQLKNLITDVEIDYSENWQKQHMRTLESAYKSSPFYDYYIEDLLIFFEKKHKYLFDYNNLITTEVLNLLGLKKKVMYSDDYRLHYDTIVDYRDSIHPKKRMQKTDDFFENIPYYQVFDNKFGFKPNLSMLDLIFNEGTRSLSVLQKCIC
ncbi:MAG TPA: hypothetical protein DDX39_00780 [Bacteroidales bacterium]|nr:MAG: hypothetical protein A2W98_08330 [Bacteroidetes bacterium GWF2_33_38]OFY76721.1 MAG: hypothetical protein A2265_02215 [Bacteroidetes bacterium RIFOXYA12_FULL_33_9]HBF87145.1 hypothetical protein [Bacteroidales bacterium]